MVGLLRVSGVRNHLNRVGPEKFWVETQQDTTVATVLLGSPALVCVAFGGRRGFCQPVIVADQLGRYSVLESESRFVSRGEVLVDCRWGHAVPYMAEE